MIGEIKEEKSLEDIPGCSRQSPGAIHNTTWWGEGREARENEDYERDDRAARSSPEMIPLEKLKDFPNAIRRAAWEIVQTVVYDDRIHIFKWLVGVMRGDDSRDITSKRLKELLGRAHKLIAEYVDATIQFGWIDMPLMGREPYLDGSFPQIEDEEWEKDLASVEHDVKDTVGMERVEDTVVKKEIKEEIEDDEFTLFHPNPSEIEKNVKDEEDDDDEFPLFHPNPLENERKVKEEEELSTRDYARYLDAAMAKTVNGTNFTASEKGALKQAIKDILFKGLRACDAADRYSVATQRLIAFVSRSKAMCRKLKQEEEGGEGPSTSQSDSSPTKPSPSASDEEKKAFVNQQLNFLVSSAKLNPAGKLLLKKAVRLVVCDGVSMPAAAARIGIAASTMYPYVTKARSLLKDVVQLPNLPPQRKKLRYSEFPIELRVGSEGETVETRKRNDQVASVDEITFFVNEVLDNHYVDKRRREKLYEILVEVLTGASSLIVACNRRRISMSAVASYLARARGRLGSRLPPQVEDPAPPGEEKKEEYPYEKNTVVLAGHRLPRSMIDICNMIESGELSHVESKPFEGTREQLREEIRKVISQFRYQPNYTQVPDAVVRMLVDHTHCRKAADEFYLLPSTVGGYALLMRMLIDVNNLTIVEADGTKRLIPAREKYERGKYGKRRRREWEEGLQRSDEERDEEEEENEEEEEENEERDEEGDEGEHEDEDEDKEDSS